jgi:hypothetical protein
MAPFFVAQIGQLRSIFVKFAQYFGGRSDVVSPMWTELLSQLQDACPASSQEYVRRTIEEQLGSLLKSDPSTASAAPFKLEDLFENFDMSPIASASIGQVHTATLRHSALMKILHLQQHEEQQQRQDRTGTEVDTNKEHQQQESVPAANPSESEAPTTEPPSDQTMSTLTHSENEPGSPVHAPPILTPTSTPAAAPALHGQPAASEAMQHIDESWYEASTDPEFVSTSTREASELVSVVVKVQHEDIEPLMVADMRIVLVLIKWASFIDSRWEVKIVFTVNFDFFLFYRTNVD